MLSTTALAREPNISIEFPKPEVSATASLEAPFATAVRMGETQRHISATLGQPDIQLTENGWVYQNITVTIDGVARPELDNLVIVFHRAISTRVAPDETLDILVADATRGDAPVTVASSEKH